MSVTRDSGRTRPPDDAWSRISGWSVRGYARTMPEADRRKVFQARLPASDWPARMLKVTAVDVRTGHFVAFDSAGDISLVDAVAASCAVPGVWPPVTIGTAGRRRAGRLLTVRPAAEAAPGRGAGQHASGRHQPTAHPASVPGQARASQRRAGPLVRNSSAAPGPPGPAATSRPVTPHRPGSADGRSRPQMASRGVIWMTRKERALSRHISSPNLGVLAATRPPRGGVPDSALLIDLAAPAAMRAAIAEPANAQDPPPIICPETAG